MLHRSAAGHWSRTTRPGLAGIVSAARIPGTARLWGAGSGGGPRFAAAVRAYRR